MDTKSGQLLWKVERRGPIATPGEFLVLAIPPSLSPAPASPREPFPPQEPHGSLVKPTHFFGATAPVLLSGGPVRSSVLSASLSEKESIHSFIAASFRALLPLLNLLA